MPELTPEAIVRELDKHIVGQQAATATAPAAQAARLRPAERAADASVVKAIACR